jgi:hypothetical protein
MANSRSNKTVCVTHKPLRRSNKGALLILATAVVTGVQLLKVARDPSWQSRSFHGAPQQLAACTIHDPSVVPPRPLRSYIPATAHVLEVGPSLASLMHFSLWGAAIFKTTVSLCHFLKMIEESMQGPDQREKVMSQWREQDFQFSDNNVIGNILHDLNATFANTTESAVAPVHVVFVVEVNCQELFTSSPLGSGNWMLAVYAMRLGTLVASRSGKIQVDLLFDCHDAVDRQSELIMPWLSGYYSSSWIHETVPEDCRANGNGASQFEELRQAVRSVNSVSDVCGYDNTPLTLMLPYMRYELRRMAVALVGTPENGIPPGSRFGWDTRNTAPSRPPLGGRGVENEYYPPGTFLRLPSLPEPNATRAAPLLSNVELDDVAIHYRCGDLMLTQHGQYGFMKFSSFGNRIHNATAPFSIGILTQPFGSTVTVQERPGDVDDGVKHLCYVTTHAFVDYLQSRFPQARIRIRNDPEETLALAYARLVLANQAFSPISSFSVFPALASVGRGYIRHPLPDHRDQHWIILPPVPRDFFDVTTSDSSGLRVVSSTNSTTTRLELMDDPEMLMAPQVWKIRFEGAREGNATVEETLINWFTS